MAEIDVSAPKAVAVATAADTHRAAPASVAAAVQGSGDAAAQGSAAASAQEHPVAEGSSFALTSRFDFALHQIVIEARDPVSGFVIFQAPPKYAVKQFGGSGEIASLARRGRRLNEAV